MKTLFVLFVLFEFSVISYAQIVPNLPIPIGAGTAEVWNNSIYHFGGSNNWSGSIVYPRIYKFNGSNWSYHDSIPDNNLWDVESVLAGDYTYLVGGWPSGPSLLRRYNLSNGEWTYLANSPNLSQTWGISAEQLNGEIFLFNSIGNVFAYNILSNSWTTKSNASASGSWGLSSVIYNNEIYVIGWNDSSFYKYTPSSDQWTEIAKSPYQVAACAVGIINNLIYCIGGNINGATAANYKSVIVYNITSNSWGFDSLEISTRRHWMATAEYNGGLYIVGGIDSLARSVDIVEEIVPQGTASEIVKENYLPNDYLLSQNYPNPFNPATVISFQLPVGSRVTLKVYDVLGTEIETLVNEEKSAGKYELNWNAVNLPSGVYFYKLQAGSFIQTRKMILLK